MKKWLKKIGRHPILMVGSFGITLVALVVMVVLFFVSQSEGNLVYAINPVRTRIVTLGQTSGLEVRLRGIDLGPVDITATQIAIWNAGDASIRRYNILRTVEIYTDPSVRILEASIVSSSRDLDITDIALEESPDLWNKGVIPLSWNILERNDGASIQIMYLGTPDVEINVRGLIESSGEIEEVGQDIKIKSAAEQYKSSKPPWYIYVIIASMPVFATAMLIRDFRKDLVKKKRVGVAISIANSALLFGVAVYFLFSFLGKGTMKPPFGF